MGRIAKIIDILLGERNGAKVSDVKANPGGEATVQADQFNTAGDDSHPLPGDYAVFIELPRGGYASVGNIDPKNAQTAQRGERRIYSRNAEGIQVAEVWLKNDGTITINNDEAHVLVKPDGTIESMNGAAASTIKPSGEVDTTNGAGYYTLQSGGIVEINNVTIDPAGNISTPQTINADVSVGAPLVVAATSLTASGTQIVGHTHPAGTPPGNTGGMNP